MGLNRRIPRELKANLPRYLALFFLILLGMYVVISVVGAADTIIHAVTSSIDYNRLEDGQFTLTTPLSPDQLAELESDGLIIQPSFYLDFALYDGSVLRLFETRGRLNLTQADQGLLPQAEGQLLLEKLYARDHNLGVGDSVLIGCVTFVISGTGSSPDYDMALQNLSDVASDKNHFGTAFVKPEDYNSLKAGGRAIRSEEYLYAYRLNGAMTHDELKEHLKGLHLTRSDLSDPYLLELLDRLDEPKNELLDGVAKLVDGGASLKDALDTLSSRGTELTAAVGQISLPPELAASLAAYTGGVSAGAESASTLLEGLEELRYKSEEMADYIFGYEIPNLISFLKAENNPRIAASADDVHINQIGGLIAGIIALMLFSYVISVFIVGNVDRDSEVIGTLYAVGLSRGELLSHYLVLPVVIAALGGICGTILGFSPLGVGYQMVDTASYFSYPDPVPYYPLYLLVYGLIVPPLIAPFSTCL